MISIMYFIKDTCAWDIRISNAWGMAWASES